MSGHVSGVPFTCTGQISWSSVPALYRVTFDAAGTPSVQLVSVDTSAASSSGCSQGGSNQLSQVVNQADAVLTNEAAALAGTIAQILAPP